MNESCELADRRCKPCEGGVPALELSAVQGFLAALDGWSSDGRAIEKTWQFRDHYETMAFVNAVAWISHREDHHPELTVGYAQCRVRYWTHAIGGLSENDFVCAAKVDRLSA